MALLGDAIKWPLRLLIAAWLLKSAYEIRLYAIKTYGLVIHEFDPWFNFRATQYLADNGWDRFFKWFDYMSWYPLGRPVGTTIYPGMQITAVWIWEIRNAIGGSWAMSLNDVCCYVPAWFGSLATFFLGLLTYEATFNYDYALAAMAIMAIVPAHIMRSVGGGFDNECVAVTAMCSTFYFWCRSLRDSGSWVWGFGTGLAYIYMAAAWGGYIFVLNMVGVHALSLLLTGRYSENVRRAYTMFYVVGTAGAMQVPVIGMTPLKSMEQLGPLGVMLLLNLVAFVEAARAKAKAAAWSAEAMAIYQRYFTIAGGAGVAAILLIYPTGYFGPLSSRIRGLFVRHTRTGNPLVDSVAEHQPASVAAYHQYLHSSLYLAALGFAWCLRNTGKKSGNAMTFLIAYMTVAYFFSAKMMRLILLMGPICSALGGIGLVVMTQWSFAQAKIGLKVFGIDIDAMLKPFFEDDAAVEEPNAAAVTSGADGNGAEVAQKGKKGKKAKKKSDDEDWYKPQPAATKRRGKNADPLAEITEALEGLYGSGNVQTIRALVGGFLLMSLMPWTFSFISYSHQLARGMSQPTIMYQARAHGGKMVMVDDYREAYWWLRDNTPTDARVMAWWDYGYQITGIGNRTTIADGNTWNHEHIATLGRCLTAPERNAHRMVRHLADYVLVWTGGGGDDLAKSPHMARISNSVYPDICPGDPTCSKFGFNRDRTPTKMMQESLLYKLHSGGQQPGVTVDGNRFKNVFNSKYNKVRIWKVLSVSDKSRKWAADPANRMCDAPGSWYCEGQYPPLFVKLFDKEGIKKKDFKQLEDFNVKGSEEDADYQKEYFDRMAGKKAGDQGAVEKAEKKAEQEKKARKKAHKKQEKATKAQKKAQREKDAAARQAAEEKAAAEAAAAAKAEKAEEKQAKAAAAKRAAKDAQHHRRRRRDAAAAAAKAAKFEDSDELASLKALIEKGDFDGVDKAIKAKPDIVHMRSADGQGPLFWSYAAKNKKIRKLLIKNGAQKDVVDKNGKTPKQAKK